MANAISPLIDYQEMLRLAHTKLGEITAQLDKEEEARRQEYQRQLALSETNRTRDVKKTNENNSARGFLNSGINLNDQKDVSYAYDRQNSSLLSSYTDTLTSLARQRLAAQNDYTDARINFERNQTATLGPDTPGIDNPDPLNWGAIDAELRANPNLDPRNQQAAQPRIPAQYARPRVPRVPAARPAVRPVIRPIVQPAARRFGPQ